MVTLIPKEKYRIRIKVQVGFTNARTVWMLSTLLIRNKDFKKYPGFFLAPLCQCEFGIFEVFLQLILTEIDEFRRRRVRFLLWGGGDRANNAYLNCTRGGRTPLIFLTRQKVYLVMDTTFSNWLFNSHNTALSTLVMACYMLVP